MRSLLTFILTAFGLGCGHLLAQDPPPYEVPPINYSRTKPKDAITRMQAACANGTLKLAGSDRQIVESLLKFLKIPESSQTLVFSKTSFQSDRINPDHPRALYYNDDCYVGWVPGGLVELTAIDSKLGPIFYSFNPRAISPTNRATFSRENDCLRCHGGNFVRDIPGVFVRSVFADADGQPLYRQGTQVVDYRTPFAERWGGWYVTGSHGKMVHRGNVIAREVADKLVFDAATGANITNLSKLVDTSGYLTSSSDIVALLVIEHQTAMQNAITRAGMDCRRMLDYQKVLQAGKTNAATDEPAFESVRNVFDHSADAVVDALLFKDEATLPDAITGVGGFQNSFAAFAPRSRAGDALKDLLLSEHLFKNRCSYLIYSEAFLALPPSLKQRIYSRLGLALDADHPDLRYTHIHQKERKRIAAILQETHQEFREYLAAKR